MRKRVSRITKAKAGALLICEPFNPEPVFKRSVILVSQHNDKGTIGFIINKPTELKVTEAMDDFPDSDAIIYWGGNLRTDSIYYVHSIAKLSGAKKISEGIYWGGDYNQLKVMIESEEVDVDDIKFIAGFCGWNPGELDKEIKEENWWLSIADPYSIFIEEPTVVWGNILQRMGHVYGILNDFPVDPEMN